MKDQQQESPRTRKRWQLAFYPICGRHNVPLAVRGYSELGTVAYCYCPCEGCDVTFTVPRRPAPTRVVGEDSIS